MNPLDTTGAVSDANPDRQVYRFLDSHGIAFQRCDHPPVYTCEQADELVPPLPGARTKNLFLRDRKGRSYFLLIVRPDQRVDLKALSAVLGVSGLSLASPRRLKEQLGVDPGSVSFLALTRARPGPVEVVFEKSIWSEDNLLCHPMVNTTTLVLAHDSIEEILQLTGHPWRETRVPDAAEPDPE